MANREKQDMTAELAEGKILPLVFKLTIPAVIAQLITFLYNIVDRMYVARIEGSGMDALAALGIVLPITLIMQAFANLVGLGGAPRAGIKLGEVTASDGVFLSRGRAAQDGEMRPLNRHIRAQALAFQTQRFDVIVKGMEQALQCFTAQLVVR